MKGRSGNSKRTDRSAIRGRIFGRGAFHRATAVAACFALVGTTAFGASASELSSTDLAELSLEELMDIPVYSVSKRKQALSDSAAAIYVLTSDDIRRSGATTIPEALRYVPGMEVGHIDSNIWAITSRGFNERFANKLLVMIDGRSVYTPLFAGTYWDVQDYLLEDIDRIEVIRGPGGTLWGSNAVNGVINIITKNAADTQGVYGSTGGGTEEKLFGGARYGGKFAENGYYRVYGKYNDRGAFDATDGGNADDEWESGQGGFRMDWGPTEDDTLMVKGDMYTGDRHNIQSAALPTPPYSETFKEKSTVNGGNIELRWTRKLAENSTVEVQAYYDRTERYDDGFDEERDTIDLEFKHNITLFERNELIWGGGYRWTNDDINDEFSVDFDPNNRDRNLVNAFVQNETRLLEDSLRLTLGLKVEHNEYTDWEFQPNARALWEPAERHTIWGAVSAAVRTPSRAENDITITGAVLPPGFPPPGFPGPPDPTVPTYLQLLGNSGFDSENLIAYELGYRTAVGEKLFIDIAAYFNDYDDLRTISITETPGLGNGIECVPGEYCAIQFSAGNKMDGHTYGVEVALDWFLTDWWRVRSGYTYMDMDLDLHGNASATDTLSKGAEGASPHNKVFVRNWVELPWNLEFDSNLSYTDNLPSVNVGSYFNLDLILAWKPAENWEWTLVGQNLLENNHREFGSSDFVPTEATKVPRGMYFKITYRR
jgi:iron complex outermembrane receptor protein